MTSVELPDPLAARIAEYERHGFGAEVVVGSALDLLDQHWIRDDDAVPRPDWPFHKVFSGYPADAVLRQRDQTNFTIDEEIVYTGRPAADRDPLTWRVGRNHEVTDLASIPPFLTWLIPRYGRHTLAAIVHDHLQDCIADRHGFRLNTADPEVTSAEADYILREAMRPSGVPFVQRWVMWAGVSARTLAWNPVRNPWYLAVTTLWFVVYGLGAGILGVGYLLALPIVHASGGHGALHVPVTVFAILAVLLSPLPAAVLWGPNRRRYPAGLIAAYVLMVVALPVLLVFGALAVYALAEVIAKAVRKKERIEVNGETVVRPHNPILAKNWPRAPRASDSVSG